MSKPQEVQFGSQPPTNADVVFGKVPETDETTTTIAGDGASGPETPSDDTDAASGDADTSDDENAAENAGQA